MTECVRDITDSTPARFGGRCRSRFLRLRKASGETTFYISLGSCWVHSGRINLRSFWITGTHKLPKSSLPAVFFSAPPPTFGRSYRRHLESDRQFAFAQFPKCASPQPLLSSQQSCHRVKCFVSLRVSVLRSPVRMPPFSFQEEHREFRFPRNRCFVVWLLR